MSQNGDCAAYAHFHDNIIRMTKLIDEAVSVLRNLPDNVAAAAARAIIEYGAEQDDHAMLSDAQAEEVERRLRTPDRAYISLDEVQSRLRRHGA